MRLTFMRSVLPLALGATMLCAQQAEPATQPVPAKDSTPPAAHAKVVRHAHHRAGRHKKTSRRRGAKRAAYRPAYTQNSVEVMNGASTQKVLFQNDDVASPWQKRKADTGYKVDVLNGTARDTQYFAGNNARTGMDEKHPVVVAVQSSDTHLVGGNKHPVVTGITAAGPVTARSASAGQKGTAAISPQPKRPAYQPDAH